MIGQNFPCTLHIVLSYFILLRSKLNELSVATITMINKHLVLHIFSVNSFLMIDLSDFVNFFGYLYI